MQADTASGWSRWFVAGDIPPAQLVMGSHSPWLVALSVLVAVGASWAAMLLAVQARQSQRPAERTAVLAVGALALGAGTWSMHFIGMLAFQLCAQVDYAPGVTLLSMLPSLLASGVALRLLARARIGAGALVAGGLLMGLGICGMHYGGMLAMRMAPRLAFDPAGVAASVLVAVGLSVLALWIRFGLAQRPGLGQQALNLLAGTVLGLAISGMHYVAMRSARFIGATDPAFDPAQADQTVLALGIAFVAVTIGAAAVMVHALLRAQRLNRRLADSEGQLRAVLDTAVDGIVSADREGRILSFNASAERIFGWPADAVLGRSVALLMDLPPGAAQDRVSAELLRERFAPLIGNGREVTGRHRDGHALALRLAISRTESQDASLYLGIVTDISARKTIESALKERETQYRTLIANMPGVAFRSEVGAQTRLRFISDRVLDLTGWTSEDFVGGRVRLDALMHADDRLPGQQAVAEALAQDRPYAIMYRITRRDGAERWVSETAGAGRDAQGQLRWIDGVMTDVTEERQRARTFETVATVLDRAMAVLELSPDGVILHCNQNYVSMLGYARADELLGRSYTDMMPARQRDGAEQRDMLDALRRGEALAGEFERVGKDGRELWIQASYNPVYDDAGRLVKIMAFKTDVTQRKAMERELRQAKARAEEAASARSSFLANMSHEIRTPMNAILGFTDVLLTTTLGLAQRRHLETVRQAGQSLLALLNDILDTAKLDRGAVQLEVADFSLRLLCEQIAASMRLAAERKGLSLALDYPADLPDFYRGDALRLQQVLVNLVGNAIKFTPRGSVTVEVRRQGMLTVVAIVDTGIGIAADRVERIFDPFTQADATITRQFGGTGLGTTIARQLAELMGGRIVVHSQPGAGSRFEVQLPLPQGQAPRLLPAAAVSQLPRLSVLVVDDVPQNVELLELLLQADGHDVASASNGQEALALLAVRRFDVVLMDVHMPVLDGLGATRTLRAREHAQGLAATPVVALTASVQAADRLAAQQAGMDGFATKPVVVAQLFGEIGRVLGLHGAPPASPPPQAAPAASAIDWEGGLTLWKSRERLQAAIASFLQAQGETLQALQLALDQQDSDTVAALAHRVAGAAGNLALPRLRQAAHGLERSARAGALVALASGAQALQDQLDAVQAALPASPADAAAAPDRPGVLRALASLQHALQGHALDENALQYLAAELAAASLRPLMDAIDRFDFDAALRCVDQLRTGLESPPA